MIDRKFQEDLAADYIGVSPSTLAKWRMKGTGPTYIKLGARLIVYSKADLDDWLTENRCRSTAEYRHA